MSPESCKQDPWKRVPLSAQGLMPTLLCPSAPKCPCNLRAHEDDVLRILMGQEREGLIIPPGWGGGGAGFIMFIQKGLAPRQPGIPSTQGAAAGSRREIDLWVFRGLED